MFIPYKTPTAFCERPGGILQLKAEARLGELLEDLNLKAGRPKENSRNVATILKNLHLDKYDSHRAQLLSKHQDLIPQVVAEAEALEKIHGKEHGGDRRSKEFQVPNSEQGKTLSKIAKTLNLGEITLHKAKYIQARDAKAIKRIDAGKYLTQQPTYPLKSLQ